MPTIAELNDYARTRPFSSGTKLLITSGVSALPVLTACRIAAAVQAHDDFEPDDERDFGSLAVDGHHVFWKIDYYDKQDQDYGSEDPADPEKTLRVLTIMLAEEY